ncbi:MAG: hypothetical protein ACXVHU_04890 [Methanobacterium sp.]
MQNSSFKPVFTLVMTLLIIFNIMSPIYAAQEGIVNSEVSNSIDNFLSFNWIPEIEVPSITLKNPFEESEEVKKISGILNEGSKFKYVKGANSKASLLPTEGGDCWAMSEWLYENIEKTGVQCRIIQYETPLANNHRSVQIKSNGEWVDLPYIRYGFDGKFAAAEFKPGIFVYKESLIKNN